MTRHIGLVNMSSEDVVITTNDLLGKTTNDERGPTVENIAAMIRNALLEVDDATAVELRFDVLIWEATT